VEDRRSETVFRVAPEAPFDNGRVCARSARPMNNPKPEKGEILIEFIMHGNVVKATAIDSVTGVEASIVGPLNGARDALADAAVRKLKYLLEKER
jgi:hypothetical protein